MVGRLTFSSRLAIVGLPLLLVALLYWWTPAPVRSTGQGGCWPVHLYLPVVLSDFDSPTPSAATAIPTAGCPDTATPTASLTATQTPTPSVTPTITPTTTPLPGWYEVGDGSASGGGISDNPEGSWEPAVAVASDGTVYIAWDDAWDGLADSEIYVRHWAGSSWDEVGSGSASGGGISNNSGNSGSASVAVAPDEMVYVAWEDRSNGNPEIYVRRWDGGSWQEVGTGSASGSGISNNSGQSLGPSIAIGPDGIPYIAWRDSSGGNSEIYVRRWNGGGWEEVGAGSASGGGISNNSGSSSRPSVAIAPDGTPYIAWVDLSGGNGETYVRRWNGSSWEEVGVGSASGGGISNNAGETFQPSAAVAPDGTAYVAWRDDSSGTGEIYVRRWNGSSWEEVGAGSASGGGISDNPGQSGYPAIAIAPNGRPYVTWEDSPEGIGTELTDIYVLQWLGP